MHERDTPGLAAQVALIEHFNLQSKPHGVKDAQSIAMGNNHHVFIRTFHHSSVKYGDPLPNFPAGFRASERLVVNGLFRFSRRTPELFLRIGAEAAASSESQGGRDFRGDVKLVALWGSHWMHNPTEKQEDYVKQIVEFVKLA